MTKCVVDYGALAVAEGELGEPFVEVGLDGDVCTDDEPAIGELLGAFADPFLHRKPPQFPLCSTPAAHVHNNTWGTIVDCTKAHRAQRPIEPKGP